MKYFTHYWQNERYFDTGKREGISGKPWLAKDVGAANERLKSKQVRPLAGLSAKYHAVWGICWEDLLAVRSCWLDSVGSNENDHILEICLYVAARKL